MTGWNWHLLVQMNLSNTNGVLAFRGRKQVAGISIYNMGEIVNPIVLETLNEAILLDENLPYASKRKKSSNR